MVIARVCVLVAAVAGCHPVAPSVAPPKASPARSSPARPKSTPTVAAEYPDVARVEPGEWFEGELVVALHEPIFYMAHEDEAHARLMLFADGRVLYRVLEGDTWAWYLTQMKPTEADALRRSIVDDLAGTPARFSCFDATHQRRSIIFARDSSKWHVHEGYALSACLDDVAPDAIPSSSHAADLPPADPVPEGFVRAYRRLRDFHREGATRWYTPKLALLWYPDQEHEPAPPWPAAIPTPPRLDAGTTEQILDGAYDQAVRVIFPLGGRVEHDGHRWIVQVERQQPGDAGLMAASQAAYSAQHDDSEAECRTRMRELRGCIAKHRKLDTRADRLCRDFTELAEQADQCTWEQEYDDVCWHAYDHGCRPRS